MTFRSISYHIQVRVLELESHLEKERKRLGDLRRTHYQLAGASEGWEVRVHFIHTRQLCHLVTDPPTNSWCFYISIQEDSK
jgi:hypothetical protein